MITPNDLAIRIFIVVIAFIAGVGFYTKGPK